MFRETCNELETKLAEGTLHSLVTAAALLRKLLMDASPLMHTVNRTHRLPKPKFVVRGLPDLTLVGLPEPDGQFLGDGLDALDGAVFPTLPGQVQLELDLDKFLAHRVARVSGSNYTVRDIIDFLAHVAGGVHLRDAKTTDEQVLQAVRVRFLDVHPAVLQIRGIARVTLRALAALREKVTASLEGDPPETP